jgi:hypothetical protein
MVGLVWSYVTGYSYLTVCAIGLLISAFIILCLKLRNL